MITTLRGYICLRLIHLAIKIAPESMQLIFCKAFIDAGRIYLKLEQTK